jgi:hypothetical protein
MTNWFYYDNLGIKQGPMSDDAIKSLIARGVITPQTIIDTEDGNNELVDRIKKLIPRQPYQHPYNTVPPPNYQQQPQHGQPAHPQTSGIKPPPDYFIWSIISTLCMCFPLGIVGIIMSERAKSAFRVGDYARAESKSRIAFWCNFISLILLVIGAFIYVVILSTAPDNTSYSVTIQLFLLLLSSLFVIMIFPSR